MISVDIGKQPSKAIDMLLQQAVAAHHAAGGTGLPPPSSDWGVPAAFGPILTEADGKIPLVTAKAVKMSSIAPNTLVRFRGMVQHTFDPEYYQSVVCEVEPASGTRTIVGCRYKDAHHPAPGSVLEEVPGAMAERFPVLCVPLPGMSPWAADTAGVAHEPTEGSPGGSPLPRLAPPSPSAWGGAVSPAVPPAVPAAASPAAGVRPADSPADPGSAKRQLRHDLGGASDGPAITSDAAMLDECHPLVVASDTPVLVHMYNDTGGVKVTDAVEVFGIYTVDPVAAPFRPTGPEAHVLGADPFTFSPPPPPSSALPRIQCLAYRQLPRGYPVVNARGPLVFPGFTPSPPAPLPIVTPEAATGAMAVLGDLRAMHARIARFLTAALGGDGVAGEFLLLHLLAGVHTRHPERPLGKVTLNITGLPDVSPPREPAPPAAFTPPAPPAPPAPAAACGAGQAAPPEAPPLPAPTLPLYSGASAAAKQVYNAVRQLLPRSSLVPLSLNNLQSLKFAPRASRSGDHLVAGVLQVPTGTYTIVDETVMSEGSIQGEAVPNLQALRDVSTDAKLKYDFHYAVEFPADVPLLLLSPSKSLTPSDVLLPLAATSADCSVRVEAEELNAARGFLGYARELPFSLSEAMVAKVQADLTALRGRGVPPDYLYTIMDLARLAAHSFGETTLTEERWAWLMALDEQRRARLVPAVPPAAGSAPPTPVKPAA